MSKAKLFQEKCPPVRAFRYKGNVNKIPSDMLTGIRASTNEHVIYDNGFGTPIVRIFSGDWGVMDRRGIVVSVSHKVFKSRYEEFDEQ